MGKTKSKKELMLLQFGFGGYENKEFLDSAFMNNVTFLDYYLQFQNNIMSMFTWKNLPLTIDERYLELQLFLTGHVIFFEQSTKNGNKKFLCLGGALFDPNIYGNPIKRQPIAMNGRKFGVKTNKDSVVIFNNMTRTASCVTSQNYAKRLYKVIRTIDVNLNTMKTPILIRSNTKNKLGLENALMAYDGNQPVIFTDDEQNLSDVLKVLDMSIDPRLSELNDYFKEVFSQGLTNQGIPVSASDKMERLLESEVNTNNAQNLLIADGKLKARKEACVLINKKWGLNIEVDYSDTFKKFVDKGVDKNVYTDN